MTKHRTIRVMAALAALQAAFTRGPVAHADIFQWEYVNPADPSQGKQQSTILAPDGAGVNAVPGANVSYRNLTMAYLIGADLTSYYDESEVYVSADLTGVNLSQADLTNAKLINFTGANFTAAEVRGARFGSGLTLAQLYSTASYQAHDLTGIGLTFNNLSGANLAGQNLRTADFGFAALTDADFTAADMRGASFTFATLTDADFTGAEVRGASFGFSPGNGGTGITAAQLYSTISYQNHDLTGIGLSGHDLTGANLAGQNFTYAYFGDATLTNVNFSQTNLTNAHLYGATITGANLTGAEVRGASFITGITRAQLYSTASYQNHDLTGIYFSGADLTDANLAGQNLTNATFYQAKLTGANLTGAEVRGASFIKDVTHGTGLTPVQLYSTASYQAQDLTGVGLAGNNLAGLNLAGQNLTNANFDDATLTDADFTGAEVRGANLSRTYGGSGITVAQLYSTASYQARDLTGIRLDGNNLAGVDLAGQNLTSADFSGYHSSNNTGANLTGANLSQANLTNANFSGYYEENFGLVAGANLTDANLSGADARGANFELATLTSANTTNLIQTDGQIASLNLTASKLLVVRDYDGNAAVARIVVDQHLAMDATGTLRLVFDADPWDSTISLVPGIPVTLSGALELTFAPGVDVATQLGRTIDLLDWSGVTPTGTFTVSSSYTWDLSNLYTTGEVTLTAAPEGEPGDFNDDGAVDAADYVVWRKNPGGIYTQNDYNTWRSNFGRAPSEGWSAGIGSGIVGNQALSANIPEPGSLIISVAGLTALVSSWRRRTAASSPSIRRECYDVTHARRHAATSVDRAR